jgi:transposase
MNKRRRYTPTEKAQIVLEVLRDEDALATIASKYDVCQQLISRCKSEFFDNVATVFDKKNSETAKLKQEHEAEKEALVNKIGQLTIDID